MNWLRATSSPLMVRVTARKMEEKRFIANIIDHFSVW